MEKELGGRTVHKPIDLAEVSGPESKVRGQTRPKVRGQRSEVRSTHPGPG